MRRGSLHAAFQQITALLLLPLSLWLALFLVRNAASADLWRKALLDPQNRLLLGLFMGVAACHAALGLEVVFEDYLSGSPLKKGLLLGSRAGLFLSALLALVALLV